MNKDLKNGLLVAGSAILLYLLYKQVTKKSDVIVSKKEEAMPSPIEVELPIESPVDRPVDKPVESIFVNAPLNI
jgi:uncharacterized membrane protein